MEVPMPVLSCRSPLPLTYPVLRLTTFERIQCRRLHVITNFPNNLGINYLGLIIISSLRTYIIACVNDIIDVIDIEYSINK